MTNEIGSPLIGITTDVDEKYLKVKHGYCEAVKSSGGIPVLIPPGGDPKPYADLVQGFLIPGGDDLNPYYYNEAISPQVKPVLRQRSDFEISLLNETVTLHKPVLGICYGMQLLNVIFGGTLYQDIGEIGTVEINHRNDYHMVVISENRFLKKGAFSVNSSHHQSVKKLGNGLLAFGYSPDHLIEAFHKEDYNFLIGVQWHPERIMEHELSISLFKSFITASSVGK